MAAIARTIEHLKGVRVNFFTHAPVAKQRRLVASELAVKELPLRIAERRTKESDVVNLANEPVCTCKWAILATDANGDRGWWRESGESGVSAIFDFPQVSLNVCAVADTITEHG